MRARRTNERSDGRGFSLVEVLVASLVLAVIALALSTFFVLGLKNNAISKEDTVMAALGQDKLEQFKRLSNLKLENQFPGACQCPPSPTPVPPLTPEPCQADCYPTGCPNNPANRVVELFEDPVTDPHPLDDIAERLYVRQARVEKVQLDQPVGCIYKVTVTVGSRNGLLAPTPTSAPNWTGADPAEVVGRTNPRRVVLSTYRP